MVVRFSRIPSKREPHSSSARSIGAGPLKNVRDLPGQHLPEKLSAFLVAPEGRAT
jgi:hypothetical protein